ncbi:MAG TPA: sulfatase-like hydrolase/transferase [Gemmatimonadaceae bacterium]|nr:sulfatase-like hydrolase/transferase [Gemmatimonadaceae bacterium]
MDVRALLSRAARVALVSAAFTTLMQAESYWSRAGANASFAHRVGFLAALPLLQWRSVVAAAVLGLVVASLSRSRSGRALAVAAFALVHALIAFDQTAFRLFGEHMALAQTEGGWRELSSSLPALFGSAFTAGGGMLVANLALAAACTWWVARVLGGELRAEWPARRWLAGSALYTVAAIPAVLLINAHHLDEFPLHALFRGDVVSMPTTTGGIVPRAALERLRDSTWRDDPAAPAAEAAADHVRAAEHRPNVLLIVLESVGSEQLLPGGAFASAVTPHLASRASDAIVLPDLYSFYPATTRAHVPLMTGGRTITWGSVNDEILHPLRAPTFVSAMRDAGYRTGLFAAPDLRFGSLADFYRTMPWDTIVYYLDGKSPLTKDEEIHSWGVNEDAVRPLAVSWVDSVHRTGRPFFLEFHTIATHYPYGTWGGDAGPARGDDDHSRYLNSLHYTDAALDRLFADLDRRGLLRNTIVAITGDHGEGFAEYHANNYLHRNAIWEENVRNFLVVLTPGVHTGITLRRLGTHGDVMPTVLALAGLRTPEVPGQDLLSPWYAPRIAYFYKDVSPAQTGLRDGRWKFIARRDGSGAQLYDLATDSTEQHNVASSHPTRVAEYRELAAAWYVQANDDYTSRIAGWDTTGRYRITRRNIADMAPPQLRVGHFTGQPGEGFVATPVVAPNDRIYVVNRWGFLPGDVPVRIVIVSPSHRVYDTEETIMSDWDTSWYHPPLDRAKEPGRWSVSVWRGGTRLASTSFVVSTKHLASLRTR